LGKSVVSLLLVRCSSLDVDGRRSSPKCPNSGIKAPVRRRVRPRPPINCRKEQRRYKQVKGFRSRGSTIKWWTHTWGGVLLCASVSYMSHIGVMDSHLCGVLVKVNWVKSKRVNSHNMGDRWRALMKKESE